jgi:hypothetical protein
MENAERMGPPKRGPWVIIHGDGIRINLQINDDADQEIMDEALKICQRRRLSRSQPSMTDTKSDEHRD